MKDLGPLTIILALRLLEPQWYTSFLGKNIFLAYLIGYYYRLQDG